MPIYEYMCPNCGHEFEIIQGIKESPLTACPACGENQLRKKLSAAAFHLKGTGWYETDFKNSGKPAEKSGTSENETTKSTEKSDSDANKTSKKESSKKSATDSSAGPTAAAS